MAARCGTMRNTGTGFSGSVASWKWISRGVRVMTCDGWREKERREGPHVPQNAVICGPLLRPRLPARVILCEYYVTSPPPLPHSSPHQKKNPTLQFPNQQMADDVRGAGKTAAAPTKKRTYTPTLPPIPSANEYARVPPATVTDAVRTIALEDFTAVHTQPCVRNSLLYGIGTGFAFGGLRLVLGGVSNYLATFSPD